MLVPPGVAREAPPRSPQPSFTASVSQRSAIEADLGPMLVLAGPGAGKTFCLIERIRFLIEQKGFDPAQICAFTFTNKAAEEIAARLERELGAAAAGVRRCTIHSFCTDLLREYGELVRLPRGFGIADEEYQRAVLGRLGVHARRQGDLLKSFALHRLQARPLTGRDLRAFERYARVLEKRKLIDFDGLLVKAAELVEREAHVAAELQSRWRYVLVDEFQDLNRKQYAVIHAIVREHQNLFAVGDEEQSIFSWTGAEPKLFKTLINDFNLTGARIHHLTENHRCSGEVFQLARRLVARNAPLLAERRELTAHRGSAFPVRAAGFQDNATETTWLLGDLSADRAAHNLGWGSYAILYRKHETGDALEGSLVAAGVPCQLAQGRTLADDPVVAYVLAALRVIHDPLDSIHQEQFARVVLPASLCATLQARAEESGSSFMQQLFVEANKPTVDTARKTRRARAALHNLVALGRKHTSLAALIEDLLSHRVGEYRTPLEERHEDLSDPASDPAVVALAARLHAARTSGRVIWVPPLAGLGIAVSAMLGVAGVDRVALGGPRPEGSEPLTGDAVPSIGLALGVFKALQLLASRASETPLRDFTAIDIETTERDPAVAEIVQIAATRVRNGEPVAEYSALVRPCRPISPEATAVHGLREADVVDAPSFDAIWPAFRQFCGADTLVAHNGFRFDFPILRRLCRALREGGLDVGGALCRYDTLVLARELRPGSRRLEDLAQAYDIDPGRAHHALDDTRTLARVCLRLEQERLARARKIALVNALAPLGAALALSPDESLGDEARLLRDLARPWALGRYSDVLEHYRLERERLDDPSLPAVDDLIDRIGGRDVMMRVRAERTPDQRYPAAMARLRRLLAGCRDGTLADQIRALLEQIALSRSDGAVVDRNRVNLLTLHSTKGLEFSRVYIVGVEDSELPGIPATGTASSFEVEEARRVLYVGMTRAMDRLVLTRAATRSGRPTGGHRFLDEMQLVPRPPG